MARVSLCTYTPDIVHWPGVRKLGACPHEVRRVELPDCPYAAGLRSLHLDDNGGELFQGSLFVIRCQHPCAGARKD